MPGLNGSSDWDIAHRLIFWIFWMCLRMNKHDVDKIIQWFKQWLISVKDLDINREGENKISGFLEVLIEERRVRFGES